MNVVYAKGVDSASDLLHPTDFGLARVVMTLAGTMAAADLSSSKGYATLYELTEEEIEAARDGSVWVKKGPFLLGVPRPAPRKVPFWTLELVPERKEVR